MCTTDTCFYLPIKWIDIFYLFFFFLNSAHIDCTNNDHLSHLHSVSSAIQPQLSTSKSQLGKCSAGGGEVVGPASGGFTYSKPAQWSKNIKTKAKQLCTYIAHLQKVKISKTRWNQAKKLQNIAWFLLQVKLHFHFCFEDKTFTSQGKKA